MLQLKNRTPFAAQLALFPNQQGIDTLYIFVKATFIIGRQWTLADEQLPPAGADEYWSDDPTTASIKYASDLHIGKPTTDVIMVGHAWAPQGMQVKQLDVALSVGHVSKQIRVFGDRQWDDGYISSPLPFNAVPLVYERAFGGIHKADGKIVAGEVRNPIGCGFAGKRRVKEMNGLALPNLEDPRQLLQSVGDVVNPAGFGFLSPNWQPRLSFAGTYDEQWQTKQAPYLPADFDLRFFNMAHPDLVYPGYLSGGEPVQISGVNPDGVLRFHLPEITIKADVWIKSRTKQPSFNLETVLIEPDELLLGMTWKAALPCDKEALKIREVDIHLVGNQNQVTA